MVRLLELSRPYENVTVPQGCPDEWSITVAIVARQRRHLEAVITLADAWLFLEAKPKPILTPRDSLTKNRPVKG